MPEPIVNTPVIEETPAPAPEAKPGEKTDPALLLKSLKEERELRRKEQEERERLEAELEEARRGNTTEEVFSDEGKVLLGEIKSLKSKFDSREQQEALESLQTQFPAIKDKKAEFDEYRLKPENAGMRLETLAKAFVIENNLTETPSTRKGLEKSSGGGRTAPQSEMTPEDVSNLRSTNFRKYSKLVREGKIKI